MMSAKLSDPIQNETNNMEDSALIDFMRSTLISSVETISRRKRTLTSSFSGVTSVGSSLSGNQYNILLEVLNEEYERLQLSIEQQIDNFDEQQSSPVDRFESIFEKVQLLHDKRAELMQHIDQQNELIEQHHLIDLAQARSFRICACENDAFLKRLELPKRELILLHEKLNEAVQADREHRYETLLQLLKQFESQADCLQCRLDDSDEQAEAYRPIVNRMQDVLRQMRVDRTNLQEKLEYDLRQLWQNAFRVRREQVGRELRLNCDAKLAETVQQPDEYINALQRLNLLHKFTDKFANQVLDLIVNSLLDNTDQQLGQELQVNEQSVSLKLCFHVHSLIDSKEQVLLCLSNVFRFLNVAFSSHQQVLQLFVPMVKQIFQLLDQKVLSRLRPAGESELAEYSRLLNQAEQLQDEANQLGLLPMDHFRDFSLGVHTDVGNKRCNELLLRARKLIKRDIFPTQQVGENASDSIPDNIDSESNAEQTFKSKQKFFAFPACQVSESILKLKELLNEIVTEMQACTTEFRFSLYRTARDVLEMYLDISPLHHQSMLDKAHQPVAVFHNNCFYLAHHVQLLTLNCLTPEKSTEQITPVKQSIGKKIKTTKAKNATDTEVVETLVDQIDLDGVEGMWKDDIENDLTVVETLNSQEEFREGDEGKEEDNEEPDDKEDEDFEDWKDGAEASCIKISNVSLDLKADKASEDFVVCFVDFVPVLRDLGTEYLLVKLREYRTNVLTILHEARLGLTLQDTGSLGPGSSGHDNDSVHTPLQSCLDRCVNQLHLIQERWQPILPVSVNYRVVGLLTDALLKELLKQIISVEDISSNGCDLLAECLQHLLVQLDRLFVSQRIELFVRSWRKSKELTFVLKVIFEKYQTQQLRFMNLLTNMVLFNLLI